MTVVDSRSFLKGAILLIGLMALFVYGYIQARNFIMGPQLEIFSPKNGATISSTSPKVFVRGRTKNISFITVNGLQIFTDKDGAFERELLLADGYTIITVEAQDKFGRSVKKELQLIVK